jgi:hypothetical protein
MGFFRKNGVRLSTRYRLFGSPPAALIRSIGRTIRPHSHSRRKNTRGTPCIL